MKTIELTGKVVAGVSYPDPWGEGLTIMFTDGTVLNIRERMQAGEIEVFFNDETVPSECDFE